MGSLKWERELDTPLSASASNAGAIFANNVFEIPRFQREYSWGADEVEEFWTDLKGSLDADSYFLGLIILTKPQVGQDDRKQVVDGQQRIITLSLLANAIYHEAMALERKALADRVQASFLRSIDYDTDEEIPRVKLSDASDDATFQTILSTGSPPQGVISESVSARIVSSHKLLVKLLKDDLKVDPFKRLGKWSEFLTNRLYFAMFVHPSSDAAYQVYEVVNTRGRDLTTADLLKNYMLSQAGQNQTARYEQWQAIAKEFADDGANNFVQYIRHVVTVKCGYVLPKDLFGFLAGRKTISDRAPPAPGQLMELLQDYLPLYVQMIDPTASGPTEGDALGVFSALNSLGVLTVRPILLACADVPDGLAGMKWILRLVVRRIVVGNLGTGNVERRLGEAARAIAERRDWTVMIDLLQDLSPSKEDFVRQLGKRKFNKQVLTFLRRSIIQKSITPDPDGVLHFIWTSNSPFDGMTEAEALLWAPTIGNTLMSHIEKRPKDATTWEKFRAIMLGSAPKGEWVDVLKGYADWTPFAVEFLGEELASEAGKIWYDG